MSKAFILLLSYAFQSTKEYSSTYKMYLWKSIIERIGFYFCPTVETNLQSTEK